MEKEKIEMTKEYEVSPWIKAISYIFVGAAIVLEFFSNLSGYAPEEVGYAMGASFWLLVAFLIAITCANICSGWASRIKESPNIAYSIGFLFGLLGLVGYWIYYKRWTVRLEGRS